MFPNISPELDYAEPSPRGSRQCSQGLNLSWASLSARSYSSLPSSSSSSIDQELSDSFHPTRTSKESSFENPSWKDDELEALEAVKDRIDLMYANSVRKMERSKDDFRTEKMSNELCLYMVK